jgi:hypothetical protein
LPSRPLRVGGFAGGDPLLVIGAILEAARRGRGSGTLAVLPLVFLLRLGLGALSYAAGDAGGLFALAAAVIIDMVYEVIVFGSIYPFATFYRRGGRRVSVLSASSRSS